MLLGPLESSGLTRYPTNRSAVVTAIRAVCSAPRGGCRPPSGDDLAIRARSYSLLPIVSGVHSRESRSPPNEAILATLGEEDEIAVIGPDDAASKNDPKIELSSEVGEANAEGSPAGQRGRGSLT